MGSDIGMRARNASSRKKSVLIICNGEPPSRALVHRLATGADYIVAADGGANIARLYGIRPDAIIGDLDSIGKSTKRFLPTPLTFHFSRQDNTDLEKCLDVVVARKFERATIVAATGGRLDFTLGNLSVIWRYASVLDMEFVGDGWKAMPVGLQKRIAAPIGTIVSLIPFGNCHGITLTGLRFPLRNASMRTGEIAVSNVVMRSPFVVRVKGGNVLLIILRKTRLARRSRRGTRRR